MKLLVVGLGLIGGSICKAIKRYTNHTVDGFDTNAAVTELARTDGSIDCIASLDAIAEYEIILVCLHPVAARSFMREQIPAMASGTVLTDVCGIKGTLVAELTALGELHQVHYVGMHPMAGKERFGYAFSDGSLFLGANCILTPIPETNKGAVCTLEALIHALGFGRIVETTPEGHDRMIAYTSQLAHVVSSAYVKSPTIEMESGYSGGSFQDMTRIATLNESMWSSLFLENRDCLLSELDTLLLHLQEYRDALNTKDQARLIALLQDGTKRKEANLRKRNRDKSE